MNHPREILRRAEAKSPRSATPSPAPVPASRVVPAVPTAAPAPDHADPQPSRVAVPRPIRQNSVYHQLMLRHDRMNQSHLKG